MYNNKLVGICTKKFTDPLSCPLTVTLIDLLPPEALIATEKSALIEVDEFTVLFDTVMSFPAFMIVPELKPRPVRVTCVVPATTPRLGEIFVIVGLAL